MLGHAIGDAVEGLAALRPVGEGGGVGGGPASILARPDGHHAIAGVVARGRLLPGKQGHGPERVEGSEADGHGAQGILARPAAQGGQGGFGALGIADRQLPKNVAEGLAGLRGVVLGGVGQGLGGGDFGPAAQEDGLHGVVAGPVATGLVRRFQGQGLEVGGG